MTNEERAPTGSTPVEAIATAPTPKQAHHTTTTPKPQPRLVTRVQIRYEAYQSYAPAPGWHADGGFERFTVSIEGQPYRLPAEGEDLGAVHDWLTANGFHLVACVDRIQNGHGRVPALWTEYWSLDPASQPGPHFPEPDNRATEQLLADRRTDAEMLRLERRALEGAEHNLAQREREYLESWL